MRKYKTFSFLFRFLKLQIANPKEAWRRKKSREWDVMRRRGQQRRRLSLCRRWWKHLLFSVVVLSISCRLNGHHSSKSAAGSEKLNLREALHGLDETMMPDHWPMVHVDDLVVISSKKPLVTLVTAFFSLGKNSKHSGDDYERWMKEMLSLQDAMVIFTTPDFVKPINSMRAHAIDRTKIIGMTLDDTLMVRNYGWEFWEQQHEQDLEKSLHSKELYIIWNEKSNFLTRAVDMNPFGSHFFSWVDIGYFRDGNFTDQVFTRMIPANLVHDYQEEKNIQRTMMLNVSTICDPGFCTIGGGYIGGFEPAIRRWNSTFYEYLRSIKDSKFIGKDQNAMNEVCTIVDPSLCFMVTPKIGTTAKQFQVTDGWFFMGAFLGGRVSDNEVSGVSHSG